MTAEHQPQEHPLEEASTHHRRLPRPVRRYLARGRRLGLPGATAGERRLHDVPGPVAAAGHLTGQSPTTALTPTGGGARPSGATQAAGHEAGAGPAAHPRRAPGPATHDRAAYRAARANMAIPVDDEAALIQDAWDRVLATKDNGCHRTLTLATADGIEVHRQ